MTPNESAQEIIEWAEANGFTLTPWQREFIMSINWGSGEPIQLYKGRNY
jgi:hypothetical protein